MIPGDDREWRMVIPNHSDDEDEMYQTKQRLQNGEYPYSRYRVYFLTPGIFTCSHCGIEKRKDFDTISWQGFTFCSYACSMRHEIADNLLINSM